MVSPPKLLKKTIELINKDTYEMSSSEVLTENPAFVDWEKHDTVVKKRIYSSLLPSYVKHLVNHPTTHEYWVALQKAFTNNSHARLMQLRWQLQTMH